MKGLYFCLIIILMLSLLLLPLCAFLGDGKSDDSSDGFKVYITDQAEIKTVSAFDYLLGVTANNLDKESHIEAIKAEAVAAYTLALYSKNYSESKNFDFNDSMDGYITEEKLKEKWGGDYNETYEKFEGAINAVMGQTVLYKSEPINALRHNISSGITEDAKNVLKGEFPYLVSVESAGDLLVDGYITEKKLTLDEFKKALQNEGLTFTDTPEKYIEKTEKTKAGNILKITILGKEFTGEEIKNIFNLPSACIEFACKENAFTLSTKGDGHFLGLSRAGAEYLAQNGNDYTAILSWYYPACTLKK